MSLACVSSQVVCIGDENTVCNGTYCHGNRFIIGATRS